MCGIAGKLYFAAERQVDPALLHRMNALLLHRGPDDGGIFHEGPVGLAHRRLSIIDLTAAAHQPMSTADGRYWITYNGEIYNFAALRGKLEREGQEFRSRSDTEVILALYARHGPSCLSRLRGMFALAVWDGHERTLMLARDRAGEKPLYYYQDDGALVFASEAKAIFADPSVVAEADPAAIHHYLSFGYVPSPLAAFRGVRKVPPGHYVLVRDGKVRTERYWALAYGPKTPASEDEMREELLARVREAVRLRLVGDVPIGAFLSGGLDSSTVVALMSELTGRVRTFSIGFEDAAYDELPHARRVAQWFGTEHHDVVVKPDAVAVLPRLVWHYNEPFADPAAVPTWYLAEMTRTHVTVALTGDGGDENFAGYERYPAALRWTWFDRCPAGLRSSLRRGAGWLPALGHPRGLYARGRRRLESACQEPRRRYGRWMSMFPDGWKHELYAPEFRDSVTGVDPLARLILAHDAEGAEDPLDAMLAADVELYLPDDLLTKVDIATMAHSLEARAPLVDHELMAFAARLPVDSKLRGSHGKRLFREAVRPLLPPDMADRPKQGFGVPLNRWFREDLREMAHDVLLSRRAVGRGLVRPAAVTRMLSEHAAGERPWHPQLWGLLVLELWFQQFIDGAGRSA